MSTVTLDHLPPRIAEALRRELDDAEVLQWSAQPGNSGRLALFSAVGVPVGLIFAAAGAGGVWLAVWGFGSLFGSSQFGPRSGVPVVVQLIFGLMGMLFLAIGIGIMLTPAWAPAMARRMVYAVTDRRVLTVAVRLVGGVYTRSMRPGQRVQISRTDRADGVGDIVLSEGGAAMNEGLAAPMILMGVRDARDVERLIRLLFQDIGSR